MGSPDPSHLFSKSMSERFGSDIERLRNRMMSSSIEFGLISKFIIPIQSRFTSDPTLSGIYFKSIVAWVGTTLKITVLFKGDSM